VLLGTAVYDVVDAAMAAEQSNVAAEAERVLMREATRALAFDWYRKNERGAQRGGGNGEGNGEALQINRPPTFRLANTFKSALSTAANNYAATMSFSERANRLLFGFINGDIILDPNAAIALQRIQDVFGEKVFVVGKRRSVTLKLKHRQSAVAAGIVAPHYHHDNGDDNGDTNKKKKKDREAPIDFGVAGWESHPIFKQSVGDRADAEDYFIWSGDFWTTVDESLKAPMAVREGWGLSSSSSSSTLQSSMWAVNNLQFIPNFHIGRPVFDNWFLNKAIQTWQPVVDASNMLLAYHQLHNYDHLGAEKKKKKKNDGDDGGGDDERQTTKAPSYWGREESEENRELALANGGWRYGTIDFVPIQFSVNNGGKKKGGQQQEEGDDSSSSTSLPSCANTVYLGLATAQRRFASSSSPLVFVNSIGEESSPAIEGGGKGGVSWYSLYQHAASGHSMGPVLMSSSLPSTAAVAHTPYTGVLVGGYDPMLEVGTVEGGDHGLSAKAQLLMERSSDSGGSGNDDNDEGRSGRRQKGKTDGRDGAAADADADAAATPRSVPYWSTPYAIDALVKADREASASSSTHRIFSNMYTAAAVASSSASASSLSSSFSFPQCVLGMKSDWNAPEELVEAYGPQMADLTKVWAHYFEGFTRQYGRQSQYLLQDGAAVQREKQGRPGKRSGKRRGDSANSQSLLSTNSLLFLLGEGGLEPLMAAGRREAMRHQQTKGE